MKLVMAETHYWESVPRVDSHHLARELSACGHNVLYLSSPVSPLHFLDGHELKSKWRRWWRYGGRGRMPSDRLRCVVPRTFAPVATHKLLDSDRQLARCLRWTWPRMKRLLRRLGFTAPAAQIVQSLHFARLPDLLPGTPLIYRMTDDFSAFPNMPQALVRAEGELVRRAQIVTASSHRLVERAQSLGAKRVEYFPHGVEYSRFNTPETGQRPAMSLQPRVVYVGAIDSWFDARAVAAAAQAMPSWKFELAGPVGPQADLDALKGLENVEFLGPMRHEDIPAFLNGAGIGLIPFKRTPLIEAVHPIKLYEYLAAGLAVVATRWDEIERIGAPIRLARDSYEFAGEVMAAASQPPPREGRAFASRNDWVERAQQLERLVEEIAIEGRSGG